MSAEEMSHRDEMQALLPFYLNGTLEGDDLVRLENWLASDPQGATALAEAEAELFGTMAANDSIRPPADALSRFTRSLDAEAGSERRRTPASMVADWWSRLARLPVGLAWATAAVALALLVVQAAMQPSGRIENYEVAGSPDKVADWPFVLMVFKPDARVNDIAALLDSQGAVIADGPRAGGIFRIAFPAKAEADYNRVIQVFSSSAAVAEVLPGRKPPNG